MKVKKRETRNGEISEIGSKEIHEDNAKENFQGAVLVFLMLLGFLALFLTRRFNLTPDSVVDFPNYYQTNGVIAVGMLIPMFFVLGYFPEMLRIWRSTFKTFRVRNRFNYEEKEGIVRLLSFIISTFVFLFLVDFSFLGVKGSLPRIGSVALLGLWGFFRNVYRLRKANWEERKRKRNHEKRIEEIRSRRTPPPEK